MLQIAVLPQNLRLTTKKTPTKTRAARPAPARPMYPSTNVSSPVRQPPPKRNIRDYKFNKDSAEGAAYSKLNARRNGYEAGNFVIPDDDDEDEDDFEPIRQSKPKTTIKKSKTLGCPITVDERIAGLDETQKDILDHFMSEAKALARKILIEKGLRNQPFSDTILREMGLDLPQGKDELLKIPGINADMVELYGKRFLRVVQKYREIYGHDSPPSKGQIASRRVVQEDDDYDDGEDQMPMDPNHQVIDLIDLVTESEGEQAAHEIEEESNYSYGEEEEGEDDAVEVSHFFQPPPIDPRVEEYNRRGSQLEADRMATTASKARKVSKPAVKSFAKGGRTQPWKKGGRVSRKSSSSGFNKNYAGVSKKGGAKKTRARTSGGFEGPKRTSGGGGSRGGGAGNNAWSGILAMPT